MVTELEIGKYYVVKLGEKVKAIGMLLEDDAPHFPDEVSNRLYYRLPCARHPGEGFYVDSRYPNGYPNGYTNIPLTIEELV